MVVTTLKMSLGCRPSFLHTTTPRSNQPYWKSNNNNKKYKQYLCSTMCVDHFYIALFSALEQTHCTRMWFCTAFLQENMWAKINTLFSHKLPLLAEREKGWLSRQSSRSGPFSLSWPDLLWPSLFKMTASQYCAQSCFDFVTQNDLTHEYSWVVHQEWFIKNGLFKMVH